MCIGFLFIQAAQAPICSNVILVDGTQNVRLLALRPRHVLCFPKHVLRTILHIVIVISPVFYVCMYVCMLVYFVVKEDELTSPNTHALHDDSALTLVTTNPLKVGPISQPWGGGGTSNTANGPQEHGNDRRDRQPHRVLCRMTITRL